MLDLASLILIYGGIAFLVLGLLAAAKEVIAAKSPGPVPGQGTTEGTIKDVTDLVQTIGKLKMWVALAVIGFFMICLGSILTDNSPLRSVLTGTAAHAPPNGGQ